jgi:stage IV sporulation protein FB
MNPADGRSRHSLRIGSLAGIELRVHLTFPLLLVLVAIGAAAPGGPGPVAGVLWVLALFACVIVHELAHSLVARHHGIAVTEIELLPFGGLSKMARLPDDPAVELRIAAAGPLASLALAATAAVVTLVAGAHLWPPTLYGGGVLPRLAWVNLLLAGLNLLPALPLDGGRVLRAVLEMHLDRARATHVSVLVARLLAGAMVAAGVLVNVWLLVIGLFVLVGSSADEAAVTVHARIKDLRVAEVMSRHPVALPAEVAADLVVRGLRSTEQALPVVTGGDRYLGSVSLDRLRRAAPGTPTGDLADATAPVLHPDDLVEDSGLLDGRVAVAAVVVAGHLVGVARAEQADRVVRRRLGQPDRVVTHPPPPPPPPPPRAGRTPTDPASPIGPTAG